MTQQPGNGRPDPGRDLVSPKVKQQRSSVARGERLQHSGALDLVCAAGVLVGFFFLPEPGDAAGAAVRELAALLLGVAAGVLVLRGAVRLVNYWNT